MALSKNALTLLKKRYCFPGEKPKDVFKRVAEFLSNGDKKLEKELYYAMNNGIFLPNSPAIMNSGLEKSLLHACLEEETLLLDKESLIPIKNLKANDWCSWFVGEKDCIKLITNAGYELICTPDHKIMLADETFEEAQNTLNKEVDWGLGNRKVKKVIEEEILRGFLFGDGSGVNSGIIVNISVEKEKEIANLLLKYGFRRNRKNTKNFYINRDALSSKIGNLDFLNFTLPNRDLPNDILFGNSERVASFLKGLFEANGWINNRGEIGLKATNKNMIKKVQILLASFGIPSYLSIRSSQTINWKNGTYTSKESYELFIRITSAKNFKEKIGFYSTYKNSRFKDAKHSFNNKLKVIKIEKIGKKKVYDFSMKNKSKPYNFANGFIVHNCFKLGIEDDLTSIYKTLSNMAVIFKYGGGVGISFSKLRPENTPLSIGGTSSGVVSFMKLFDLSTEIVKQGGRRRGALMGILDYNHPSILAFITSKLEGILKNFNISVLVKNEFFDKIKNNGKIELIFNDIKYGEIKADDLFSMIAMCAWKNGDPGLLFFERANRDNPYYPKVILDGCNPCGEVPLMDNGICCLGSINLSKFVKGNKFNFKLFEKYIELGTRTLLNMNGLAWMPTSELQTSLKKYNFIGLGFMGFADALIKLSIYYDSEEALKFIDEICKPYVEITNKIAKRSFYKRIIAPTGSLSILANTSSGIEPPFARSIEKHLSIGKIKEIRDLYNSKYCKTALEISPEWHLKIQAQFQKYCDGAISKTINLPYSSTIEDIKNIYLKAHELDLKGITIFRDGCRGGEQVLKRISKCDGETCHL